MSRPFDARKRERPSSALGLSHVQSLGSARIRRHAGGLPCRRQLRSVPLRSDRECIGSNDALPRITTGNFFSCAALPDQRVVCWGDGRDGELGNGVLEVAGVTVVTGLAATAIDAGFYHVCAIDPQGGVWCWGENSYAQVAMAPSGRKLMPVAVAGLPASATRLRPAATARAPCSPITRSTAGVRTPSARPATRRSASTRCHSRRSTMSPPSRAGEHRDVREAQRWLRMVLRR